MRGLRESARCWLGSLWVAGTLALALSCVPAVALAEENAGSEAPAAPDPVALTQDASEPDAKMPAADGDTDSPAAAMPDSGGAATGTTRWTNRRIPIPCNPPSLSRPASKPLATDSNMSTTTGRW